jgi:thermostable 8-oxoguanine DNA glycosylase
MRAVIGEAVHSLELPPPDDQVLPGIPWGRFDEILTPAFWRGQVWQHQYIGTYTNFRLGQTLVEEVAACLLGGFGMKAELGVAAFTRLRDYGLLKEPAGSRMFEETMFEEALSQPFIICGKSRRYRFQKQKARYLAACLQRLIDFTEPNDDAVLRDRLTQLPGIGPKTASWIVRNHRASNSVAIIDVHILRAGRHINLFAPALDPLRDYHELESRFLSFAGAISAPATILDSLIWDYMRRLPAILHRWVSVSARTRLKLPHPEDDQSLPRR